MRWEVFWCSKPFPYPFPLNSKHELNLRLSLSLSNYNTLFGSPTHQPPLRLPWLLHLLPAYYNNTNTLHQTHHHSHYATTPTKAQKAYLICFSSLHFTVCSTAQLLHHSVIVMPNLHPLEIPMPAAAWLVPCAWPNAGLPQQFDDINAQSTMFGTVTGVVSDVFSVVVAMFSPPIITLRNTPSATRIHSYRHSPDASLTLSCKSDRHQIFLLIIGRVQTVYTTCFFKEC